MHPSYLNFDKRHYFWKADIDYRAHPELYKVGKGEQGVLICEPYKSEILPFWKFKDPDAAKQSSKKILHLFQDYIKKDDFVGADLARKFLQMGFTRARRYANYKGGKKYGENEEQLPKGTGSDEKAEAAAIFYKVWKKAESVKKYAARKAAWKKQFG